MFTYILLDKVKLFSCHRKGKEPSKGETALSKAPRNLGHADTVFYERFDCTTLQLCGEGQVISKWINGDFTVGGKYQKKIGAIQRIGIKGGSKIFRDPWF